MKKLIWTLPIRIFHWLLAIGFIAACISSVFHRNLSWHYAFGLFVGAIILFRVFFGFFGPKYAHFRDFPISFKNQKEFIKTYFSKTKVYAGHNPLAAIIMLIVFIVGILCSVSGYLLYATKNQAIYDMDKESSLKETHEMLVGLFLILVVIHLIGILADFINHRKTGTIKSIFTGYKNVETEDSQLNGFQKIYSFIWFIVPFFIFYLAYGLKDTNQQINDEQNELYEQNEDIDYND